MSRARWCSGGEAARWPRLRLELELRDLDLDRDRERERERDRDRDRDRDLPRPRRASCLSSAVAAVAGTARVTGDDDDKEECSAAVDERRWERLGLGRLGPGATAAVWGEGEGGEGEGG